jgi:hypothetical protein
MAGGTAFVATAAGAVMFGSADVVVAAGVESMTMVPMTGNKLSVSPEAMERVSSVYTPMGITAENVANRFKITREQQDAFAKGMGIIDQLGERPISDEEKSWFRGQFGIAERPRYSYTPRKPLPSGAPNTMQRKPKAPAGSTKPTGAGDGGNVPTVNSPEEYDKLPKGTRYKDSQGNEGVKR